ncbi:MAG: Asp-tRNA(Asn)/Glu-tRNA(Gln) amidotransferase subunit GatC [Treponema sp.]|nr:Asp-tRNA(Asn)/Glu-tRNA(Gln) amidotransferase subunit GatC [Treponema sp.]
MQDNKLNINDKLISNLENLSYLSLSADERSAFAGDLQHIMDSLAGLNELNTDGVSESAYPFNNVISFRDDKAYPSFERDLILKNAQAKSDEFFIAPKTVE